MAEADSNQSVLKRIRALAMDVDGVLTDGGVYWGPNGEEWKRFCFADIMGVSLARRTSLTFALISGEASPLVDRYAAKMQIQHVTKGCRDKAAALREFAASAGIELKHIAFIGDDVNDLPAMKIAGFSAAPANAAADVLAYVDFVAQNQGGNGAVREVIEAILRARGLSAAELYLQPLNPDKSS
jgi:3-deoxy-D-manno-octulosonate 8-phosphate phosphatase (KDO 8-P phosphatase)